MSPEHYSCEECEIELLNYGPFGWDGSCYKKRKRGRR